MLHYALFAAIVLAVLCYMDWQVRRVFSFYGIGRKKWYITCFRAVLFLCFALLITLWPPGIVIAIHFLGVFIITNLIEVIIKRFYRHRQADNEKSGWFWKFLCHGGILQVLAVFLMLGYGYCNVGHIDRTEYIIETDKISDDYRIVFISDTHYGTVQNPAVLQELMAEIGTLEPDFIVLGGDIVEGGTSKESMEEVFYMMGKLDSRYGIYYVYGNHDRQEDREQRGFTDQELEQTITDNGIIIIKDEYAEIGDDLILAGRDDVGYYEKRERLPVEEILEGADCERYIIMLDHQPVETAVNGEAGADLQLSGHTHAGQAFPAGLLMRVMGMPCYGEYQMNDCKLIVSSGASVGVFPIRTEKHCEYVVIELKKIPASN